MVTSNPLLQAIEGNFSKIMRRARNRNDYSTPLTHVGMTTAVELHFEVTAMDIIETAANIAIVIDEQVVYTCNHTSH